MLRRFNSKPKQSAKRDDDAERNAQKIMPKFLNFLETDLWNIPIANFVEQNSIVFDREQDDVKLYKNVHAKYKNLVDTLIESYCQDAGIVGEKLVNALKSLMKTPAISYKEKVLLESIIASQDFNVFVPMMMRKNVELQLQALKMIEHLHELPTSLKLDEEDEKLWNVLLDEDESERLILISVLKQSKAEWERDQRLNEAEWQRQLEEAKLHSLEEKASLQSMLEKEQKQLDDAIKMNDCFENMVIGENDANELPSTSSDLKSTRSNLGELRIAPENKRPSYFQDDDDNEKTNKFDYRSMLKEKESISEDVVQQRALYLRQQRDKLLAKKCKEREKQLNEATKSNTLERPKTAKAARNAMQDELESRRSLAAKIKANVVGSASSPTTSGASK